MRGVPFTAGVNDILDFFNGFGDLMKTDIVVEVGPTGKRKGHALVFFDDEDIALRAKEKLDR